MLDWKSDVWFYPKRTGDPGRDRNARTVQVACFLLACAVSMLAILNVIARETAETPLLVFAVAGLVAAMIMNRAGRWEWAARTAFSAVLLTAILLVLEARDGFRSLAMLMFPAMLLLSVMLLDRASYLITAGTILVAVAAIGIAERQGLTRAVRGVRSPTTYESIFFVDLNLLVFAIIGSRIARDAQSNVFDLRTSIDRVSMANLELSATSEALRESEQQVVSIYNTVRDVIFHLAVEPERQFRFVSVNEAFLKVTGWSREMVVGKTVSEVIPGPSLVMALGKYRQAIEDKTAVVWEETSDYPTGRLTGEVSVVPVFDSKGTCSHLVGSVHDITERKLAETELRDSEERFRNMAERLRESEAQLASAQRLAKVGSFERNIEHNSMKWSEEKLRIIGLSEAPPSLAACVTYVHPNDRQKFLEVEQDVRSTNSPVDVEYRIVRPDGEARIVRSIVEGIKNDQGVLVRVVGASQDITEQVKAREVLRESEEHLKTAERIAHLGHWN